MKKMTRETLEVSPPVRNCASPPDAHHPRMRITPGCASPPDAHQPWCIIPGTTPRVHHPQSITPGIIKEYKEYTKVSTRVKTCPGVSEEVFNIHGHSLQMSKSVQKYPEVS